MTSRLFKFNVMRAGFLVLASALLISNANAAPLNLVPNGSFEAGNSQFTSNYAYTPGGNTAEGQYTVAASPTPWNGFFVATGDHTSGAGLMMVANGSSSSLTVWQSQQIPVTNGVDYFFEAFVNNVCCTSAYNGPNSAAILEFSLSLNGGPAVSLGTAPTNLGLAGTWEGLSRQYSATGTGNVVLSLINRNPSVGGNDFAVDDIFFGTESIVNPGTPRATNVPTLSQWGLVLLSCLLALYAVFTLRRRFQ